MRYCFWGIKGNNKSSNLSSTWRGYFPWWRVLNKDVAEWLLLRRDFCTLYAHIETHQCLCWPCCFHDYFDGCVWTLKLGPFMNCAIVLRSVDPGNYLLPGFAFARTESHWSRSSASNCALLRMDPFARRLCSSINILETLVKQKDKKKISQTANATSSIKSEIIDETLISILMCSMLGDEKITGHIAVRTWSRWSCWLGLASPPASARSNRDCWCCTPYLEAREARQPTAWLYSGSGLQEYRWILSGFLKSDALLTNVLMYGFSDVTTELLREYTLRSEG